MEIPVLSSAKRCPKSNKGQKEQNPQAQKSKSPSRNLVITNRSIRKENRRGMKKLRKQHLLSYLRDVSTTDVPLNSSQDQMLTQLEYRQKDILGQTIDLCDGDDSVGNTGPNVLARPSCRVNKNSELIDLSRDQCDKSEVIDLTEAISTPEIECNENSRPEPTVIDISGEESINDYNVKPENDEIFVIGTFSKHSCTNKKELPSFISLSSKWNNFNSLISCSKKSKKKCKDRLVLDKIDNKKMFHSKSNLSGTRKRSKKAAKTVKAEENIYVNSPVTLPSKGLRPIIIDGSNVAFVHSKFNFSCKRLEICINYFKEKGHKVTAFVPQFRMSSNFSDDPQLLRKLERQGDLIFTPSKRVDGRYIVPYDDRFIIQTAVLKGGVIVSRDNFNDLLKENPAWAHTIKYRTLAFTWVDDMLMFPKDPLGEYGPTLEDFLRFH